MPSTCPVSLAVFLIYVGTDQGIRHCLTAILRYMYETLRLPQHVQTDTTHYQIRFPSHFPNFGELHMHLRTWDLFI